MPTPSHDFVVEPLHDQGLMFTPYTIRAIEWSAVQLAEHPLWGRSYLIAQPKATSTLKYLKGQGMKIDASTVVQHKKAA